MYIHLHICTDDVYKQMHVFIYIYIYIHTICVYVYTCMHVYIYIYMSTCIHTYIAIRTDRGLAAPHRRGAEPAQLADADDAGGQA